MSRDSASTASSTFAFGPGTGAFSNNSTSSPSSRRSSTNLAAGTEKFSRLGQGLPTVAEIEQHHTPERPSLRHNSSSNSSNASTATSISTAASSTRLSVVGGGSGPVSASGGNNLVSGTSSIGNSGGPPPASGNNSQRGHVRSKSMKEQLAHFGQENNKDSAPKTLQSLQDMISSLKTLPAVNNYSTNNNNNSSFDQQGQQQQGQQQGQQQQPLSRHEKRQSMSSLPSRTSMSHLNAASGLSTIPAAKESPSTNSNSTTLHISQPPRGTTIENALQSTVATLRRLSVSDSKRPVIPGVTTNKTDDSTALDPARKANNRRSVVLPQEMGSFGASSTDYSDPSKQRNRRSILLNSAESPFYTPPASETTPASTGYQPNRRSVIIRPEEVAALQEGRSYAPRTTFDSDDEEADAVADALSALEGKGSMGQRSSFSANKAPHRRSISNVDLGSLAEFASKLPSHMQPGSGSAAFQNFGQSQVNNDDIDRRRYTTAFNSLTPSRTSVLAPGLTSTTTANRRLSSMAPSKDLDRKDWRMSTPVGSNIGSNRDSILLKDNANGRRPLFMAHLTYSDFHSLLTKQKHKYVQGVLRINKRNRSDAYVTVDSLPEGDVYICGSKDRNRALEGDVVGIELIDFEDMPQQKLEGGKEKKKYKRSEDVEEAGEADVEDIKPKYCGRVVSIVERSLVQMFSGTLTLQRPSGSTKKNERRRQDDDDHKGQPRIVWFKPTDKRVPLIAIPIDQAPADFVDNHASYAHKLFIATIKRWPLSSLHPFGHLERELGDIGNIEIETEALLADNNITTSAFGEKVEKCLPELPWSIPDKEQGARRDLRQSCTFTIDPATAKDLDDAVSCVRLEDGTFEVGVHIADVSHFIKVGSALDREAKSRATTVYLVQKAIPMLPNVLSEDLCSLIANVDRLTFSVFWRMSEAGDILETTFAKTLIRSCAQLSYDDAQRVITTGALDPKVQVFDHPRATVEDNIKTFFKLSQILRQRRFDNGALSVNSIKLAFETDNMQNPLDAAVFELKESNRLIEEFMLLANMSVAKQIFDFFPEQALLRRHEEPLEKRMADFIQHMKKIGIELDASSAGALQTSMDAIQDPDVRKVIRLLVVKPMHRAKYICSGVLPPTRYHHYALNTPLYTHFTSPIRRYADIIVHRLLEASLTGDQKFYLNKESCQKSANQCNLRKDAAKLAEEQSNHLYLSALLKHLTESKGEVIRDAIVVQVMDNAFDVLVPEFALEKRIHLDQLPLESFYWNEEMDVLKLYWGTQAFKTAEDEQADGMASRRQSLSPNQPLSLQNAAEPDFKPRAGGFHAMDHPDDATNAYDDERGLFDDDSDYDDDDGRSAPHSSDAKGADDASDELAHNLSKVKTFGHVQVLISAEMNVSPPIIKVIPLNPFAKST
ncbi:hypothetical protein EC957_009025 [Mortierella hygrophila]|uniref:DIS3-like exonuclease 2 n=1 Tax=Mortierella hygrophila TaxID=979708 RepID=A0A9P6K5C3_9FUNG|nr:hypothetical protein EC957_009025 [Mortierella hygrophila]